jgi:Rieske Fe-S protein
MLRRSLLQTILAGFSASVLAALAAIPGIIHLLSPVLRKTADDGAWLDLGPTEELQEGQPVERVVTVRVRDGWQTREQNQAVFVILKEGQPVVLSPVCPHLSCPISYEASMAQFLCPCHRTFFDAQGNRLSGPSPRGMDPLPNKVEEGRLYCQWVNYQTGLEQPVQV